MIPRGAATLIVWVRLLSAWAAYDFPFNICKLNRRPTKITKTPIRIAYTNQSRQFLKRARPVFKLMSSPLPDKDGLPARGARHAQGLPGACSIECSAE